MPRYFLGIPIRERPVSQMLDDAKIIKPSTILANMIALRIAQLPPDPSAPYKGQGKECFKLRDGREIEVRFDHERTEGNVIRYDCVVVGLPGAPRYKSVELSFAESDLVLRETELYRDRSLALMKIQRDAANQEDALSIVEKMI